MVNKWLIGTKRGLQTAPWRARRWIVKSCAGAAPVVSAKVPKARLVVIVGRSSRLAPLAVKEWRSAPLLFSNPHVGQNEQP
jgi:hypothetical protein